jgi:hypothetical protein
MKTKLFFIISLGMLIIASCSKYPPSADRVLQDLAVYTQVDESIRFSDYKTFSIVPSITYIDGNDTTLLTSQNALALIDRTAWNMTNRGFKQLPVSDSTNDLGIYVTAIKGTTTTVYYPGWYWGYYPSYWGYSGYYYGYPYYPTYSTTYTPGTVIIDLIDFKNPSTDHKYMIRWYAYIRGLLTETRTQSEILTYVDQAFTQTPSLTATP